MPYQDRPKPADLGLTAEEGRLLRSLRSPRKIQEFIVGLHANFEEEGDTLRSVRGVLKHRKAHCIEAAFVAACALWLLREWPHVLWIAVLVPLWLAGHHRVSNPWALGVAGVLVLVPLWHAMYILHSRPWQLIGMMSLVWMADTAAYTFGRLFGRSKMAPLISPGKTWAGALGAAVMVPAYGFGLATVFPNAFAGPVSMLLIGVMMLLLSIEGDLLESWLKRVAGVKDSGTLLPGHGGILDRVDALAAARSLGVTLDVVPVGVARANDLAVQKLGLPSNLKKGTAFEAKIFVQADHLASQHVCRHSPQVANQQRGRAGRCHHHELIAPQLAGKGLQPVAHGGG